MSQELRNLPAIFSNLPGQIGRTANNYQPSYEAYQASQQIAPASSIFAPAQVWRQLRGGETQRAGKAESQAPTSRLQPILLEIGAVARSLPAQLTANKPASSPLPVSAKTNLWDRIGKVDRLQTEARPALTSGFATDLLPNSEGIGSTLNYIVPPLFALKAGAAAPPALPKTALARAGSEY